MANYNLTASETEHVKRSLKRIEEIEQQLKVAKINRAKYYRHIRENEQHHPLPQKPF